MDDLLLHERTRQSLQNFLTVPGHALCLIGPPGAGKSHLAHRLARQLTHDQSEDSIYRLDGNGGIEQVRAIRHFLRLKKPGGQIIRRAVIIENAGHLSDEAQNALLKMLEEPPADTVFILTAEGSSLLKPTIYSRTQRIVVLPVERTTAVSFFEQPEAEVIKAYHLSGGYAGLLCALLRTEDHDLLEQVEQAKKIMKAAPFERLRLVDSLAKDREQLPLLFYALQRVIGAVLASAAPAQLRRLTGTLRAIYEAEADLTKSANPKLVLTDLFLHL